MAEKKSTRRIKKPETMRQKVEKETTKNTASKKPRRLHQVKTTAKKPFVRFGNFLKKEIHLPGAKHRSKSVLHKKRSIVPKFLINSWNELKLVTWPDRKQTAKLTFAVIVFAIVFGAMVAGVDYVLDKIFREVIL
jgi:preprotein translocase SecE subunit